MRKWMDGRPPAWRRELPSRLALVAAASLVMAVTGPFGTYGDLDPGGRLVYWGTLIASGTLLFESLLSLAFRWLPPAARHPWPVPVALVLAVGSGILTAEVMAVERWLRHGRYLETISLVELYLSVLVVSAVVGGVPTWLGLRRHGIIGADAPSAAPAIPAVAASTAPAPTGCAAFLRRIQPRLGSDLLALEMEDHYVRVHTALGSDLILMRLRDAMDELAGLDGLQVHRSYWVAAEAVSRVERTGTGRLTLTLRNGMEVPVSRTFAAAVRTTWLKPPGGPGG